MLLYSAALVAYAALVVILYCGCGFFGTFFVPLAFLKYNLLKKPTPCGTQLNKTVNYTSIVKLCIRYSGIQGIDWFQLV